MNGRLNIFLLTLLTISSISNAQVQVSEEPRHKNVFENKYLRLLDVNIQPGDTTLFHIHSTPSVFLTLTSTNIGAQKKGLDWGKKRSVAGTARYQSFLNDTLIHRVSNFDAVSFHVTDMEILASYDISSQNKLLPFDVIFDNEKVVAYRLSSSSINQKVISNRGPIIAELVEGNQILYHNAKTKKTKTINKGGYLYIKPESSFYLTVVGSDKINLVLFEIK